MSLRNRKMLVTGGAGFIGSHLVDKLIEQGANVIVLDDLSYGKRENVHRQAEFVKGSVLDYERLKDVINNRDTVFHLAASATTKESSMGWDDPIYDYEINAIGTLNILRAIRELGQKTKVVYASSAAVYGQPEYTPITETHPNNPISPYGISKLSGEKYCFAYSKEYGINSAIIRIFNTYGPRQPRYVMDDFIKKLRVDPSKLEIIGSGEQTRDFCYVSDVVTAFITVAESQSEIYEVYNVGSGESTSIKELAEMIVSIISPNARIVSGEETWKGDIKNLGPADITKLKRLGFSPKTSLSQGLKSLIDWHNQTRNLERHPA
ncbi:NAD-dependent epimerase/dehydratase family protein [candidate division NPL-UPA2 bacterium]|nr:NAD-dependent epimerase/dehydratase family protein [candidate division NPL-UPA2 bacterium]